MSEDKTYIFVVDTKEYAGNFERELVAWMTGQVGECEVGDEEASLAKGELTPEDAEWFEDHVRREADENGCRRPAILIATPGLWNDGHGNVHPDGYPEDKALAEYLATVEAYALKTEKAYADPAIGKREADRQRADWTKPSHCPAYYSVGCFLDTPPDAKIFKLMSDRAKTLWQGANASKHSWKQPPTITGFRLLCRRIVEEEIDVTKEIAP